MALPLGMAPSNITGFVSWRLGAILINQHPGIQVEAKKKNNIGYFGRSSPADSPVIVHPTLTQQLDSRRITTRHQIPM